MDNDLYVILTVSLLQLWILYSIFAISSELKEVRQSLLRITFDLIKDNTLQGPDYDKIRELLDKRGY